jgi:hypothetical protein
MRPRVWAVAAWLAMAGWSATAAVRAGGQAADAPGFACGADVDAARQRWEAVAPPLLQPPLTPGTTLRHWPTRTLGVWLVEDRAVDHATLTRVDAASLTRLTWASDCRATTTTRPRPAAPPPAFSDVDLARVLATGGRGVLYLWSPHMPLSVDGYSAVVAAAQARGLTVEPLLDPAADRTFAGTEAAARALPPEALRVADAVELQFRELALHAPSALAYADGRFVGSPLRGFRTAEEYSVYFDRELGRR